MYDRVLILNYLLGLLVCNEWTVVHALNKNKAFTSLIVVALNASSAVSVHCQETNTEGHSLRSFFQSRWKNSMRFDFSGWPHPWDKQSTFLSREKRNGHCASGQTDTPPSSSQALPEAAQEQHQLPAIHLLIMDIEIPLAALLLLMFCICEERLMHALCWRCNSCRKCLTVSKEPMAVQEGQGGRKHDCHLTRLLRHCSAVV